MRNMQKYIWILISISIGPVHQNVGSLRTEYIKLGVDFDRHNVQLVFPDSSDIARWMGQQHAIDAIWSEHDYGKVCVCGNSEQWAIELHSILLTSNLKNLIFCI